MNPSTKPRRLRHAVLIALAALALTATPVPPVTAQDDQQEQDRLTALAERQKLVERKMAQLEATFEIIAQKLETKEPERAKRLVEALQQAKEKLIAKKMKEITQLLDANKLSEAEEELDAVILNLEELVRLLLNEQNEDMSRQQEIEMLKKWREQIIKIKKEQQQQTRETSKIANKDDTLKNLGDQIKQVEQLIKKQTEVNTETEKNRASGLQALDRIADKQFGVRKQTEDLAKQISGEPQESQQAQTADQQPKPGEDSKPAEQKPGEQKPANQQQPQNQGQNQQGQNQQGQNQQGQSGQQSQQQGQQQQSQPAQPKQPGQKPLEDAAQQQRGTEQNLTQGKAAQAKQTGEKALDELKKALAELKKEKRRIASLPPEAFEKMARDQRRTQDKTEDLAKEMSKAPKPSNQDGQDGNQGQAGQKPQQGQPGQQNVQRAQKSMQNAAGDLSEQDPQRAERQQKKAEEELDKALREIEERLDQLREETREEKLARLEARFREMLARQQIATIITIELEDKRTHLGKLGRRDLLTMLRLSSEELEIRELGQQAYDLLLEDGTSTVFPEVVQDVREDLARVAQFLESEQTGPLTQLIQQEIESTLEELLEALKRTQRQGEGGGGGQGGGNQPLLRKSAELKMLRAAQLRVNRLTKQFDLIRPGGKLGEAWGVELKRIRVRQADIVEMMIQLMEKE